jgi:hypothetical protein
MTTGVCKLLATFSTVGPLIVNVLPSGRQSFQERAETQNRALVSSRALIVSPPLSLSTAMYYLVPLLLPLIGLVFVSLTYSYSRREGLSAR